MLTIVQRTMVYTAPKQQSRNRKCSKIMDEIIACEKNRIVANDARTELHDKLGLTGSEISIKNFPAGTGVPFVHIRKQNEEIYTVLSGKGKDYYQRKNYCSLSR